ncbi:hypothetical protein [Cupriavidus basilensis]|nr:hypothetical protein [Cupriavidus basilensis]
MKLRARSGSRHVIQSSHSARGTMTIIRLSLPGAWKRFISGCLSESMVRMVNESAPSYQSRHRPAMANSGSSFSQIRQRKDLGPAS